MVIMRKLRHGAHAYAQSLQAQKATLSEYGGPVGLAVVKRLSLHEQIVHIRQRICD